MSNTEGAVYLEDVETSATSLHAEAPAVIVTGNVADADSPNPSPTAAAGPDKKGTTNGGVKRQRTLMDMFPGGGDSAEPSSKKLKPTTSSNGTAARSTVTGFGLQPLNSIPFSLSAYQESLSEEQSRLLRLECEVMGMSWLKLLKDEIKKPYFLSLKEFLWKEGVCGADDNEKSLKVYPSPKNIYAWSKTPLGKVKVVIVGQDPYHGKGQAHGLCFSVPKGVAVPPSLRNIYAEIKAEYPDFQPPTHGNLSAWATNGVLMLNTCLTVRAGQAGSHSNKGWEEFTDKVVDVVDKYGGANFSRKDSPDKVGHGRGVVFLAWGNWAAKRVAKLDKTKHLILISAHPSPFSANKGFLGNGHFKAANDWLEKKYGPEGRVDWCNLDCSNTAI